jgi:pimeloyl-ACP methyl ester carboxylesterase
VTPEWLTVDGLDVLRQGPADAFPLVFHCGTPNAPVEFPLLARGRGARLAARRARAAGVRRLGAALGGLVDDVDRAALTGEFAEAVAGMVRRALSAGVAGWRDDDLAFVKPWGFDLEEITVPVSIWHGAHDRMVPVAHGRWLAAHVPGARVRVYDDEGHLSLIQQLPRILDDLVSR